MLSLLFFKLFVVVSQNDVFVFLIIPTFFLSTLKLTLFLAENIG